MSTLDEQPEETNEQDSYSPFVKTLAELTQKNMETMHEYVEHMAAAYFQKTGIDPKDVVLVQEYRKGLVLYYYAHKNSLQDSEIEIAQSLKGLKP